MTTVQVQIRKWGQSLGLVIPKETVDKNSLSDGEKVDIIILKRTNALKETFGKVKFKRPIATILKEVDKEAWND